MPQMHVPRFISPTFLKRLFFKHNLSATLFFSYFNEPAKKKPYLNNTTQSKFKG